MPPVVVLPNVCVLDKHNLDVPVIAAGEAVTDTTCVADIGPQAFVLV